MMEQTNYFAYAADGDFEMLRLPYKGSNEVIWVFLIFQKYFSVF